jgi:hypothetical protein
MSAAVASATSASSTATTSPVQQKQQQQNQQPQQQQQQQQQQQHLSGSEAIHSSNGKDSIRSGHGVEEDSKPPAIQLKESRTDTDDTAASSGSPLSSDLRRILVEVANTGSCSFLSWSCSSDAPLPLSTRFSNFTSNRLPTTNSNSSNNSGSLARQPQHSFQRRPTPLYATAVSERPLRKKHRNGMHGVRQRRFADGSKTTTTAGRKRPLFLIRTTTSASTTASGVFSPGSVGSGRTGTSGSEPEDTSQYECDSEGTSATTNSELSFERRDQLRKRVTVEKSAVAASVMQGEEPHNMLSQCKSLKDVFRTAVSLVLDHFYKNRGGYKLSPAEKRRNETLSVWQNADSPNKEDVVMKDDGSEMYGSNKFTPMPLSTEVKQVTISAEEIFQQRRQRLLIMLGQASKQNLEFKAPSSQPPIDDGPPFTIQRIAEVLVAPERYYAQTHKLCNCLEKLLLVTSSTSAFGGIRGGDTSQSRREETELAALADERGRLHSEFRQRRLRRRASPSDDVVAESSDGPTSSSSRATGGGQEAKKEASPEKKRHDNGSGSPGEQSGSDNSGMSSREILEAAARASLRAKFDHVGIDPHSSAVGNRDVRAIAESRGMTNSPPPPSIGMAGASAPGMVGHGGLLRQHHDQDHPSIARVPSPLLFNSSGESSSPPMASMHHANPNMHLLQMHHAAAFAGVSPFELMGHLTAPDSGAHSSVATGQAGAVALKDIDLESRSSASSDVDSESDDVSFDDSASDRSDGSDSGHFEPFSAARAMALNRMQQQQRLQSRMLTSLGSFQHQGESGFRPPTESEYQSGDSIDSTRAEDSGGSDSSSSDVAD